MRFIFNQTPLRFMIASFNYDEAISYLTAKRGIGETMRLAGYDFNPPLYYLILHFWMKVFGGSEIALRGLSLVFYAINIYFVFLFLENILKVKGKIIWVYLLTFAFNPLFLSYAFTTSNLSLLALLITLSLYYWLRKNWLLYLIFSVLGLYTHYFFLLVIFVQFFFQLLFKKRKSTKKIKIFGLVLVPFLPWLTYAAFNWSGIIWPYFLKMRLLPSCLISILFGFYLLFFRFNERLKGRRRLFLIFFLLIITFYYLFWGTTYNKNDKIRQTIGEIKKLAKWGDYLYISDKNFSLYFIATYYFDENRVYLYQEEATPLPFFIKRVFLPENKIVTKLPHYPKKAFILDNDSQYRILSAL